MMSLSVLQRSLQVHCKGVFKCTLVYILFDFLFPKAGSQLNWGCSVEVRAYTSKSVDIGSVPLLSHIKRPKKVRRKSR